MSNGVRSMVLGIFQAKPARPKDVPPEMWEALRRAERCPHTGTTETEPFVEAGLAELGADLANRHHRDLNLRQSRNELQAALLARREAIAAHDVVTDRTEGRLRAGRDARRLDDRRVAPHLRAEGARAAVERERAERRRADAERRAEQANQAHQNLAAELTDGLFGEARQRLASLQRYLALLNVQRAGYGLEPLAPLPADLADRLVLDAGRRPGEPPAMDPTPNPNGDT